MTLAILLEHASHLLAFARRRLASEGDFAPMLVVDQCDAIVLNVRDKAKRDALIALFVAGRRARSAAFVSDAWVTRVDNGERVECVQVVAVAWSAERIWTVNLTQRYTRTARGIVFEAAESYDEVEGAIPNALREGLRRAATTGVCGGVGSDPRGDP